MKKKRKSVVRTTNTKTTRKKLKQERKDKRAKAKLDRKIANTTKIELRNKRENSRIDAYARNGGHGFKFILFRRRAKPNSPFFFNGKTYYATDKEYLHASKAKASYELEMNKILCNAPTASASSPQKRRRAGSSINSGRRKR